MRGLCGVQAGVSICDIVIVLTEKGKGELFFILSSPRQCEALLKQRGTIMCAAKPRSLFVAGPPPSRG